MENESNERSILPVTSVVILGAAIAGIAIYDPPIESDRRAIRQDAYAVQSWGVQRVHGRLWQDPLVTVMAQIQSDDGQGKRRSTDATTITQLRDHIAERLGNDPSDTSLLILPMILSARTSREAVEERRRQRLALVSGLASRDYVAANPEQLGYLEVAWDAGCFDWFGLNRVPVPFEWFFRDDANGESGPESKHFALVLYLAEEYLRTAGPSGGVSSLVPLEDLVRVVLPFSEERESIRLAVIGPATSEGLQDMALPWHECPTSSGRLAGTNEDDEAHGDFITTLDLYLDDGLPDSASTLREAIEPTIQEIRAADRPSAEWTTGVRKLREQLGEKLPNVADSDPHWRANAIAQWLGVSVAQVLSPDELADLLWARTDVYLDSGIPPEFEREQRSALLESIAPVVTATGPSEPLRAHLAEVLQDTLRGVEDSDPFWAERVVEDWYKVFVAEPGGRPSPPPGQKTDSDYTLDARVYVESLDSYLDDGFPNWADRDLLTKQIAFRLKAMQSEQIFSTIDLNDDVELLEQIQEAVSKSLMIQQARAEADDILDTDLDWLDTSLATWGEFRRSQWRRKYPRYLRRSLVISGRATKEARGREANSPVTERCSAETELPVQPDFSAAAAQLRALGGKCSGPRFWSVVPSDSQLTAALVDEIAQRDISAGDQIAIVSEIDTTYGRALPRAFRRAIHSHSRLSQVGAVHEFTYFRGLDGILPEVEVYRPPEHHVAAVGNKGKTDSSVIATPKSNQDRAHSKEDDGEKDKTARSPFEVLALAARGSDEPALGTQQFDSVRRLAKELSKRQEEGQTLRAVAVLGTDVYDKHVFLQALRDAFPNALFLTTDLDARFMESDAQTWSRNLIVAAGYDLMPPKPQRGEVEFAPFRDSYQTATFVSVSTAIDWFDSEGDPSVLEAAEPQLFEIGSRLNYTRFGNEPQRDVRLAALVGLLLAVVLARGLSTSIHTYLFGSENSSQTSRWMAHGWVVFSLLLLGVFALVYHLESREPFEWFHGYSAWPSELIRVATLSLAIGLLLLAVSEVMASNADLADRYDIHGRSSDEPEPRDSSWLRRAFAFVRERSVTSWLHEGRDNAKSESRIESVWSQYRARGARRNRIARIGALLAPLVAMVYLADQFWPLHYSPVRGSFMRWADHCFYWTALGSVVVLSVFVIDASRLCRAWVEWMGATNVMWGPGKRREALAARFGLDGGWQDAVDPLLNVELVAQRTQDLGRLLTYPFVVGGLFCLSQLRVFDAWTWTVPILLLLSVLGLFALLPAFTVRAAAERARTRSLARLREFESLVLQSESEGERRAAQIRLVAEAVRATEFGAFAPWRRHAILGALLIPVGGLGLVTVLELASIFGI